VGQEGEGHRELRLESRAVERVPLDGALSDRLIVECGTLKVRSQPGSSSKTSSALLSIRLYYLLLLLLFIK